MSSNSENIVQFWHGQVSRLNDQPAYKLKKDGVWITRTWREYGELVKHFAIALLAWGLKSGDTVAILGNTREEWDIADRSVLAVGGIGVGIYHSNPADQIHYILKHSDARILVLENLEQWNKFKKISSQLPLIERIVVMDPHAEISDPRVFSYEAVLKLGQTNLEQYRGKYWMAAKNIKPNDPAIIVYTSGTTGPPKGAILSHGNIMAILGSFKQMGVFEEGKDRTIAWLPLPHVFGRFVILSGIHMNHFWGYAGALETIIEDLAEIQPTVFHSVPRIYEKIYSRLKAEVEKAPPLKKKIFDFCLEAGLQVSQLKQHNRPIPYALQLRYILAKKLLFNKLSNIFGGEAHAAVTGGAPLSREILDFFHAAGIIIQEGYGLTESPLASFNRPDKYRFGSVGPAVPGAEIKLAADGEILIRSPLVFQGYFKDEEKTKEAFDSDGWFYSGDVGVIDEDGFVFITDRKKDLIITSGGKNVAPQNIENLIKSDPLISQVLVYGDRRNYLTALITLDQEELEKLAAEKGMTGRDDDYAELTQKQEIYNMVEKIVQEKNSALARFEMIKKFKVLPFDFTQEAGELTPTLKLKRRFINEKYGDLLQSMYES